MSQAEFGKIAEQLGGELVNFEPLLGGSSAIVHALDIELAGGEVRRVVVRQHPSDHFKGHANTVAVKEFAVLNQLHTLGFAVARPLLFDQEQAWLVTDWVSGSSDVAASNLDSALEQMAAFLVALHQLDPLGLEVETFDELEDPLVSIGEYLPDTPTGIAVAKRISEATVGFEGNVSLASNQRRLVHGDYWPGNVLWRNGQLAAVIDWEDAQLGDPLADLAGARVELLCQYDERAMDYFTDLYLQGNQLDLSALPIWEAYVSASALATMHLWGLDPVELQRRRACTSAFFDPAAAALLNDV